MSFYSIVLPKAALTADMHKFEFEFERLIMGSSLLYSLGLTFLYIHLHCVLEVNPIISVLIWGNLTMLKCFVHGYFQNKETLLDLFIFFTFLLDA